jgi:hypothetical protein
MFEELAEAWEKIAALRQRDLIDAKTATVAFDGIRHAPNDVSPLVALRAADWLDMVSLHAL